MRREFQYRVHGLVVGSDIELPQLSSAPPSDCIDVQVRVEAVDGPDTAGVAMLGENLFLTIPGVAKYRVRGGRRISIQPESRANERDLRVYLLGSAFGALLHQRGLLPLHANAVEAHGKALVFAGPSGAGKSTMAASFADQGYPFIADDICAIEPTENEGPVVRPGVARLRLRRDSLEGSGRSAESFASVFDGVDKFELPIGASVSEPVPLAAVYILESSGKPALAIERLTGVEAVQSLAANTYRGQFVRLAGKAEQHLNRCVSVARVVPIFRAARHENESAVDRARRLRAHSLSVVRESA